MNISVNDQGDVSVVHFEGNLDTNTAPEAQDSLDRLGAEGVKKIIVNFQDLDYISSAGLHVFEISHFSMILSVFGTEAEALEGF